VEINFPPNPPNPMPTQHTPVTIVAGTNNFYLMRDGQYIAKSIGDSDDALEEITEIRDSLNALKAVREALEQTIAALDRKDYAELEGLLNAREKSRAVLALLPVTTEAKPL